MTNKKNPRLCVVFDTNALYTQVASDLVRQSVARIIKENSDHSDLDISWHLPDVVINERHYQMSLKASELLPSMGKMEKLIGHAFGISEDSLGLFIDKAIDDAVSELGIEKESVDVEMIDWNEIISRSVSRRPPFEAGEKEKGFRDAVIGQTFIQMAERKPSTPSICRLAIVSEDKRLREYITELTTETKNVRVLSSLDELESLINTLVSEISEDFASELAGKALEIFFQKDNEKTLYYKMSIRDEISEKFSKELSSSPVDGLKKKVGTWWVSAPVFIKKNKSRLYWVTSIEPEFELYHFDFYGQHISNDYASFLSEKNAYSSFLEKLSESSRVIDYNAKDIFEVHWSCNLTSAHNLTSPKIEKIEYLGNTLNE